MEFTPNPSFIFQNEKIKFMFNKYGVRSLILNFSFRHILKNIMKLWQLRIKFLDSSSPEKSHHIIS